MHAQGAYIYPRGTLPISPDKCVAEAVRPPIHGGLYMFPPVAHLQSAKRVVNLKSPTSKVTRILLLDLASVL